jgi:hypothetical protein
MITIHKFPLHIIKKQEVEIPNSAEILTAQIQDDVLQLWAKVNTEHPNTSYTIVILGTGHEFPGYDLKYISTIQHAGFVWHIFQVIEF